MKKNCGASLSHDKFIIKPPKCEQHLKSFLRYEQG